eukprot:8175431-Pyramimonas_sp.AAC.1
MRKNRRRAQAVRFKMIGEDTLIGPREALAAEKVKLDKSVTRSKSPRKKSPRRAKEMPAINLVKPQALGVARKSNHPGKELAPAGRAEPGGANYAG